MAKPIPRYMQKGSHGPHVIIPQLLACATGYGEGIVFDKEYGEVTARAIADWQADHDLDADGNCGPETRLVMQDEYGIDFEAACRTIPLVTIFVQPDGSEIAWSPDDD